MLGLVFNKFLWIKCPKNGCQTYENLLTKHGWETINLFENNLDLSRMIIWAHITDPHQRHTKGVNQYIKFNPDINIDDPIIGKILVSAVFDEHTYSLSMMLGPLWNLPIYWIPLDQKITKWNRYPTPTEELDGDDLTNDFFLENHIPIQVTKSDRLNLASTEDLERRVKIEKLKSKHSENYSKIVKNFLEPDLLLYQKVVDKFHKKYQNLESN